jgi:hypothetical protein
MNFSIWPRDNLLERQYYGGAPFSAVDIGGTRTKLGAHGESGWRIEVTDTPTKWPQLISLIKEFNQKYRIKSWSLGMPGGATVDGPQNGYTVCPLVEPDLSVEKIRSRFLDSGVVPPALIVNDTTAVAYGALKDKLPLEKIVSAFQVVCQISIAVGNCIFKNHQLLLNPDGLGTLGSHIDDKPLRLKGRDSTYCGLADWKAAQEWLTPELRGLRYHELAEESHPDIDLMVEASALYVGEVVHLCQNNCQLVMSGGGALAFRPRLEPLLAPLACEISWADDAEQPGLDGLRLLTMDAADLNA